MRLLVRRSLVLVCSVASAGVSGVLVDSPAASADVPTVSYVTMTGDTGDYISGGTGREWWSGTGGGTISVSGDSTELQVDVSGGPSGVQFTYTLAAPAGQQLAVGEYTGAQRTPFRTAGRPGIDIYGDGRGCNEDAGAFTVRDIGFDPSGVVNRLDLSYEQHCEGGVPATYGDVVLGEPYSDPVLVMPGTVAFPATYPGTASSTARIRIVNAGSSPLSPSSLTLSSGATAQFAIRSDGCSGTTVAAGSSCLATVRYAPPAGATAPAQATLTEADDGATGTHTITLSGTPQPGHTSWEMTGDAGDYIVGANHYSWTPANATIAVSGSDSHLQVSLNGSGGSWWYADFSAGSGDILAPGDYTGAARDAFRGTSPGLDVYGDGRGCNGVSGSFHVYQYDVDPDTGDLKAVSITWEQHCEAGTTASYGSIAWHATDPAQPPPGPGGSYTDTTGPGNVSSLVVTGTEQGALVTWVNPAAPDYARTIVRVSSGTTGPGTVTGGAAVYSGSGQRASISGLLDGRTYAFSVFTQDTSGNVSGPFVSVLRGSKAFVAVPRVAPYGLPIRIGVGLEDVTAARGNGGQDVRLYTAAPGSNVWHPDGVVTTDSRGVALVTLTFRHKTRIKAVFAGATGFGSGVSAAVVEQVRPFLTGHFRQGIRHGQREIVHGTIRPALRGAVIRLQRRVRGHWRTFSVHHLDAHSRFRWSFTVARAGTYTYRVTMPPARGFAAMVSQPFVLHVH